MELSILESWVNTNSGSTNLTGLGRMADLLEKELRRLPGRLERIPLPPVKTLDGTHHQSGDVLRLRFRPEAPLRVLFSGHMDTVFDPDHPFQKWELLENDKVRGPGVSDMKGGLFIMIESVRKFLEEDTAGTLGGEILINADEELGSLGSHDLLVEAAKWNHLGLVFESCLTGGELVRCRKGTGTFKVTAHGKAAHTGRDFAEGRNAVAALSVFLAACHKLNGTIPEAIINVANCSAPGPVNVVPDRAQGYLNIRIGHPDSASEIREALHHLMREAEEQVEGIRMEIAGDFLRLPKTETPANAELHALWNEVEERLSLPLSGKRDTGGSSDGNVVQAAGLPHLDGIGIMGGAIHSDQEYALLDSIPRQITRTVAFLNALSVAPGRFNSPPFAE
ncbi:MAG: hydrolase [Opitutales bacterium]|jgi:glutamate carboxypeptidase